MYAYTYVYKWFNLGGLSRNSSSNRTDGAHEMGNQSISVYILIKK
jgi:hypothetical protein